MKLIIDIPEEDYILATKEDFSAIYNGNHIAKAIKNGTPLEQYEYREKMFSYLDGVADGLNESGRDTIDVLDKIRAEIERATIEMDYDTAKEALDIIDKYTKEQTE